MCYTRTSEVKSYQLARLQMEDANMTDVRTGAVVTPARDRQWCRRGLRQRQEADQVYDKVDDQVGLEIRLRRHCGHGALMEAWR